MGNPSSEAARRRSPQKKKQFNGKMVKGFFCFVLVLAFAALATTAPPYLPEPQIGCAAPWTQLSTGCYRFHESPMTQSEAKKFCEEEQEVPARLIEIDSVEENNAIQAEMNRRGAIHVWFGITDKFSEGHWRCSPPGRRLSTPIGR